MLLLKTTPLEQHLWVVSYLAEPKGYGQYIRQDAGI